jgi:carboxypeptidase C (cathepsin A)
MKWRIVSSVCLLCFLLASHAVADDAKAPDKKDVKEAKEEEKLSVTQHSIVIDDKEIKYTATVGKMAMKTDAGKTTAHVFFIAYTKDGVTDTAKRPITFCFNGGPGSASVWLHLGMLGPRRVKMPDDTSSLRPPYKLDNNPHSLLDVTDLVFIDPVSTGFSRPAKGENKSQFHGFDEDIRSVGQFIHDWTTRFMRWPSPKLMIGESYGGMRAAGLSGYLHQRYKMELNGVVLVSAAVDFQTLRFSSSNNLPYVLFLPGYTATAWYHKALPGDLQKLPLKEVVQQAEQFAINEYATALLKGDSLPAKDRSAVAEKLARYSGLSKEFVDRANLRVSMSRFGKELLRDRGLTVGRFDSRYTGVDRDNAGERYDYDASAAAIFGPFAATLNDYVRRELKYEDERVYEILTGNVHPWNYDGFQNRYVSASDSLRQAMTANRHLKLFVAGGYFDLATPPFTMDYSVNHLALDAKLRENITSRNYEAGHMMYVHEPSMKRLRKDLLEFYKSALP